MPYYRAGYARPRYVKEPGGGTIPPSISASGSVALPGLAVRGFAGASGQAAGNIELGSVRVAGVALWDSNTARPLTGGAAAGWQLAQASKTEARGNATLGSTSKVQTSAGWKLAAPAAAGTRAVLNALDQLIWQADAAHSDAAALRTATATAHADMLARKVRVASRQQDAAALREVWATSYQDRLRHARPSVGASYQDAVPASAGAGERVAGAAVLLHLRGAKHQDARRPPAGKYTAPVVLAHVCYTPSGDLVFTALAPASLDLVFSCGNEPTSPPQPPRAAITIPARRRYFVQNSITLTRVDTGAEIPVQAATVTEDWAGWGYQVSATVSAKHEAALAPASAGEPVELELVFNGTAVRWVLETEQRERDFPRTTLSLSGACAAALLDAPWSASAVLGTSQAQTLQQIAAAALTHNGVSLGWVLNWQAADWLVPAGLWTARATPIAALDAIARAAGAFVQPSFSAQTLHVVKKYRAAPWDWDSVTPDYELPAAVVRRESIQRITAANYNRVMVVGDTGGGLFDVRRAGSAADVEAEQISEPLVCTAAAAAARALPVLADVGRIERQTLKVPVLASLGLVRPGRIIRYVDGGVTKMGVTTSLSAATESGVAAYQTLGVTAYV
jgi:hypothetical protein